MESEFSYRFRMGLTQFSDGQQSTHPLLPSPFTSSEDDSLYTWPVRIAIDNSQQQQPSSEIAPPSVLPFFNDHVVHGAVLMPGVAFVEMIRQAYSNLLESKMARAPAKSTAIVIKRVRFLRALVLEPSSVAQLNVKINTAYSTEEWQFQILDSANDYANPYAMGKCYSIIYFCS